MNDLSNILELIKANKSEITSKFGIDDIAVFGSYAKGNNDKESDLDIFVSFRKERLSYDNFMDLKFFIEDLVNTKIDLVIKDSIRKEFQESIFSEAVHV